MMPPVVEGEETTYPHQDEENATMKTRHSMLSQGARRYKWYIGATVLIIVVFAIILGVTISNGNNAAAAQGGGGGSGSQSGMTGTGSMPTGTDAGGAEGDALNQNKLDLLGRIKSGYTVLGLPSTHMALFEDADSAQTRALNWVAASGNYGSFGDDQKLQRFALASFFYSTYAVRNPYVTQQVPWTTAEKWLSEADECEWEGISCATVNGNRAVTGIELEEHRISGSLPLDLVLLRESLKSIILTNNLIFMEGDALNVFGYLENLETIMMADNYVVERNGLPESLRQLKNLKKLVLSYNLLQGEIKPNYFSSLAALTHLEVESNYLSGPLPESLYEMPQLVYLYLRRNDFNFNFPHAMLHADWPNIFSLWLDHNNITGTFPTEFGKLTGLASFSLTNTTVRGTIPTEIGLVTGLRRAWLYGNHLHGTIPKELANLKMLEVIELYGNKLEGSVPQGVCDSIKSATYDYKVLSADCQKVTCDGCCTTCY